MTEYILTGKPGPNWSPWDTITALFGDGSSIGDTVDLDISESDEDDFVNAGCLAKVLPTLIQGDDAPDSDLGVDGSLYWCTCGTTATPLYYKSDGSWTAFGS